jgi:fatty-acyl-CoA synthase
MFLDQILKNIKNNSEKEFLTINESNVEKIYTYNDLKLRITILNEEIKKIKSVNIVCIEKQSIDLFVFFISCLINNKKPCFYSYPSPKQNEKQFFLSVKKTLLENNLRDVVVFDDNSFTKINEKINGMMIYNFNNYYKKKINVNNLNQFQENSFSKKFLQFSSGTTGHKKVMQVDTDKLIDHFKNYNKRIKLKDNSVVVSWLPHYHDMGLIACMLMPIYYNSKIYMMSPFDWIKNPLNLLRKIDEMSGTHVWLPNFAFGVITKTLDNGSIAKNNFDLSSLQFLTSASEPVIYQVMKNFNKISKFTNYNSKVFNNLYGMAENIFAISTTYKNFKFLDISYNSLKTGNIQLNNSDYKIASAGTVIDSTKIKILNRQKKKLKDLKLGEIYIKSSHMMDGYLINGKLEKTNGWLKTGDLGFSYLNNIYITGRSKDIIIIGGENINPIDIEKILNEQKNLIKGRNVVFGVYDKKNHTDRIVVLAETEKLKLNEKEISKIKSIIFNQLNVNISDFLFLKKNTLFKSTAGKISRTINKEKYLKNLFNSKSNKNHLNMITKKKDSLIELVNNISNGKKFTKNTNLFEEGILDSFNFVELTIGIEKIFNLTIPEKDLRFENFKSIEKINDKILQLKESHSSKIENINNNYKKSKKSLLNSYKKIYKLPFDHKKNKLNLFKRILIRFLKIPIYKGFLNNIVLKMLGIEIGRNVKFCGAINLKIRGPINNIKIGSNIEIGGDIDLRIRENGKIIIKDCCIFEDSVRIVSSQQGKIKICEGVSIGKNTIINGGADLTINSLSLIGSNVSIGSSEHNYSRDGYIKSLGYKYQPIEIGEDVLIGAGATVIRGTKIENGCVISSNSLISGKTKEFGIYAGVPAKIIRMR